MQVNHRNSIPRKTMWTMPSNAPVWHGTRRALGHLATAALLLTAGCSTQQDVAPLPVQQSGGQFQQGLSGRVAMIGGRLTLAHDGRSRLPYAKGSNDACVATQATAQFLLFSAAILGGPEPSWPGIYCEHNLPQILIIQLETRRGGPLIVQPNGVFSARVPVGTYLVAAIDDDGSMLPVRFAFQAAQTGDAYDLGNISVNYSGFQFTGIEIVSLTNTPNAANVLDPAFARFAEGRPLGIHRRAPIPMSAPPSGTPGHGSLSFRFRDAASLNSYIASAIAELHGKGTDLLIPAVP